MADNYETVYHVGLFDDLHNYLPAILYEPSRFRSIQDILSYIQTQSQNHFNLFSRGRQLYNRSRHPQTPSHPPIPTRPTVNMTTHETIDITPLFTTRLNQPLTQHGITAMLHPQTGDTTFTFPTPEEPTDPTGTTTPALDIIMNILQQGFLRPRGTTQPVNLEPVVVRPTTEQIEHATTLRVATDEDEEQNCSICQDCFLADQTIRQIIHCEHNFHNTCIDPWFQRNVHCPVCRFDIRDHQ